MDWNEMLEPVTEQYAKDNNITLHMLFGVPKPDGITRPILNLSDKYLFGVALNQLLDDDSCTVQCA